MRLSPLLFSIVIAGCASSSSSNGTTSAPVIDKLEMPDSATLGADGYYTLVGKISFHDDDDGVRTIRISVPAFNSRFDVSGNDQKRLVDAPLVVKFSPVAKGNVEYEVTLIDASGATATEKRSAELR